jgi:serine/threonine protein kinase/Tfp pilus assembly protein PilF
VDSLLAAHDRPANPLDCIPQDLQLDPTLAVDEVEPSEHIGMTIGSYRLMEQIGEGGFGLVFVAQQDQPVKRKVALKIIKPGTGSQEVLARFNAERQAVAMMDHPNIAYVFDAGVTDDARPYFVMELVRGKPITEFCDAYDLKLRERLKLFQDVCAATQHAHQKGIIHRDLKPSNVMVTLHDDKPVVKVIDFGVAKAVGQNLTDETIYTRFYSMIGTPLYMSPEQAAMSGLDVDTRSDIYSLGVLLYELLTGTTPFDRGRLDLAGYDEMRRIIREEEPPRPSTRLTTIQSATHDRKTRIASRGGGGNPSPATGRAALSAAGTANAVRESIPGDLDWIVMKAMEKDRTRRYESAAAMSADVSRFLSKEPIEARPPSRSYRLRKFAGRNRVALLTGSLVAAALVAGTIASLHQASIAITERNEKETALQDAIAARQEVEQFAEHLKIANVLVGNARMLEDSQQYAQADSAYSEAVSLVPNYYLIWVQRAAMRAKLNLWDEAAEDFAEAMRLEAPIDSRQWEGAAAIFQLTDRQDDYREFYARFMTPQAEDATTLSLNAIRSCVIAPASEAHAQRLVTDAETILRRVDDTPGRPGDFRGGPPGRQYGQGGARRGPGFGPVDRRDGPGNATGGPRGPEDRDHAPRSVKEYVAAWANLRAGNARKSLDLLDAASQAPGPSADLVHSLSAIALHRLGEDGQAAEALRRADEALDRMIGEAIESENAPWPWIDFVETVLLHREATLVLTGREIGVDPRIEEAQQGARALLSL